METSLVVQGLGLFPPSVEGGGGGSFPGQGTRLHMLQLKIPRAIAKRSCTLQLGPSTVKLINIIFKVMENDTQTYLIHLPRPEELCRFGPCASLL